MRYLILTLALSIVFSWSSPETQAQNANTPTAVVPQTFQDPAVPMIALPTRFKSKREHGVPKGGPPYVVADLKGPGCVRHLWFLAGKDVRLEINVDGAKESQVNLPLNAFFGIMHNRDEHFVDSSAVTVLPGYNSYLPIPFQKSCVIKIHAEYGLAADSMVDWHQYDEGTVLTPFRFHTAYTMFKPAPPRGGYVKLADIGGDGFLAGVAMGYIQRNKKDMVFHTGGMTILLDGESDPHEIRGHNVEDDFGFTWGFRNQQTRWLSCPWHDNRGRNDQDGTFLRFFGPDPIAFRNSVSFRSGSRGDDMESVVYYYKRVGTTAPKIVSPAQWEITGLYFYDSNWEQFKKAEYREGVPVSEWPQRDNAFGEPKWTLKSDHGWIDLQNLFFDRTKDGSGGTPFVQLGRCAYARTNIESETARKAIIRLAVDDWAIVWLNGEKVATLRHDKGLETAKIPVNLKQGSNELLVKTNNTDNHSNRRLWVINCLVE